jgi:selenide,water dikinase
MQKNQPPPIVSDLVLIGGGHSHVHILKMLGMPDLRKLVWSSGIRVTLIAKDIHTPYSGMLPGYVAGHYTYDEIHLDLSKLCRFSNIHLVHAACTRITYHRNENGGGGGFCECDDGRPPIRYDCLSIDVGSAPGWTSTALFDHPNVIPVKPISNFCNYYQQLQNTIVKKYTDTSSQSTKKRKCTGDTDTPQLTKKHTVCIVGGGAGGIELALSVQYNLQHILREAGFDSSLVEMIVVTRGQSFLAEHNAGVRKIFRRILEERNVKMYFGAEAVGVVQDVAEGSGKVQLVLSEASSKSNTTPILFDDCLWCTSASGAGWLSTNTPFETDDQGFVKVENTYQVVGHPGVFAAGDCCHMVDHPRPKGTYT